MSTPLTARELADLAARGNATELARWALDDTRDTFKDSSDDSQRSDVDVSAMLGAQHAIDQGPPPQAVVAAGAPDLTFAELVEKHVRRALASQEASRGSPGGEMRIELSDAVLPGTALALRRTSEGWRLSATSDNRQSLDRLNQYAPALVERFARASLGRLEISVGDS
jgi:hypothetical protein